MVSFQALQNQDHSRAEWRRRGRIIWGVSNLQSKYVSSVCAKTPAPRYSTGAGCVAPVAGFERENKLRIQAQAVTRRQPDVGGARSCLLEWYFFRCGETLPGGDGTSRRTRSNPRRATRDAERPEGRPGRLPVVRSEVLPTGRHPGQIGPHEHGSCRRVAPAISG